MSASTLSAVDDGDDERTYSVAEYNALLNAVLNEAFPDQVWVRGEVKGLNAKGTHAYFDIVDDSGADAMISVKLFAGVRARVEAMMAKAGMDLANGIKVRIAGRPDVWAPRGSLGFKMSDVDPRFTLGELALQREELLRRLRETGLADANSRRPLSPVPLRIGLVTSDGSAAFHDFTNELQASGLAFDVRLVDSRVQGEQALIDVPAAITRLGAAADLDVVVVVRGGGSKVDLAAFDSEVVAMAIAACPLPVFTGIGHEIDRSIADEVAMRSFKTPTACAAALVDMVRTFVDSVEDAFAEIVRRAGELLAAESAALDQRQVTARHLVEQAVQRSERQLASRSMAVHARVMAALARASTHVDRSTDRLRQTMALVRQRAVLLDSLAERLRLLDPANALARGWSITRRADGGVVRRATDLSPGDLVLTTFADGTATSRVEEVKR
jgi:exodeoxyribonuclease VII large subunit